MRRIRLSGERGLLSTFKRSEELGGYLEDMAEAFNEEDKIECRAGTTFH